MTARERHAYGHAIFVRRLFTFFVVSLLLLSAHDGADAEARSRVFINGRMIPVYFSDGDSYRQLAGEWAGRNSRLAGFNTLESYGPAHQWGNWHPYELWILAKQATYNARRGVWHCTSEGELDTYGRVLLDCPDLAVDQIRKGFAHAMNIDDTPSRPEYIRAQLEAIQNRAGMWAHGVPSFVVTSLHSHDEDSRPVHSNRMVSTRDGHSERWEHTDIYSECTWQCATEIRADQNLVRAFARTLREDRALAPQLTDISNILLIEVVDRFARLGEVPAWLEGDVRAQLVTRLGTAREQGQLGQPFEARGACVLYAAFRRRYGNNRAACLIGHGSIPEHMMTPGAHP